MARCEKKRIRGWIGNLNSNSSIIIIILTKPRHKDITIIAMSFTLWNHILKPGTSRDTQKDTLISITVTVTQGTVIESRKTALNPNFIRPGISGKWYKGRYGHEAHFTRIQLPDPISVDLIISVSSLFDFFVFEFQISMQTSSDRHSKKLA